MKHFHFSLAAIIAILAMSFSIASTSGKIKSKLFDTPLGCFANITPIGSPTLPPATNPNWVIKTYLLPHTFPPQVNQFPVQIPTGNPIDPEVGCIEPFLAICCYHVTKMDTNPFSYKVTGVVYGMRE